MNGHNCLFFLYGGSFRFIGFSSPNPLLPFWGRILSPHSLREEILFSLSTTSSSLSGGGDYFSLL